MQILLCYDISKNSDRSAVAKKCSNIGTRVQKSVFSVTISRKNLEQFMEDLERYVGENDSILVLPLCADCSTKAKRCGATEEICHVV